MKRIFAFVLVLALCAALVACGDNGSSGGSGRSDSGNNSVFTQEQSKLEEFLKTNDGISMADGFKRSAEADGTCKAECYAQGDVLVFDATFTQEIPADKLASVKQYIAEYLADETFAANFDNAKAVLKQHLDGMDVTCKVIYRAMDGSILGERTY